MHSIMSNALLKSNNNNHSMTKVHLNLHNFKKCLAALFVVVVLTHTN